MMVTTGPIRRAKLQLNCHHQQTNTQLFTSRMPFQLPNPQHQSTEGNTFSAFVCMHLIYSYRLYAGPSCTICQFQLYAGQCKSTANQRKLLYIFGSKVAICMGDEFDQYESNYIQKLRLGLRLGLCSLGYCPAYNTFWCFLLFTGRSYI